jgi:hypothetical protein
VQLILYGTHPEIPFKILVIKKRNIIILIMSSQSNDPSSSSSSQSNGSSLQVIGNMLVVRDSNGNIKLPNTANGNLKIAGSTFVNASLAVSGNTALCSSAGETLAFFGSSGTVQPEVENSNMTAEQLAANTTALSKMVVSLYNALSKLGLVK